jgi:hypothetical protein
MHILMTLHGEDPRIELANPGPVAVTQGAFELKIAYWNDLFVD